MRFSRPGSTAPAEPETVPRQRGLGHGETRQDSIRVESGFYQQAYQEGLVSGRVEPHLPQIDASRQHGGQAAEAMHARPFSPEDNAADAERQAEHDRDLQQREKLESAVSASVAEVERQERALAGLGPHPRRPFLGSTAVLGTLAGALPLGLVLWDSSILAPLGPVGAGVAAAGASLLVGGSVVNGMLAGARQAPADELVPQRGWWWAGAALTCAVGVLGCVGAEGQPNVALGVFMALLEGVCFSVVALRMRGLAVAWRDFETREQPWRAQAERVAAAQRELARRERERAEVVARIEAFVDWLAQVQDDFEAGRQSRAQVEAAVSAAYEDAVGHSRGFRQGNARRPPGPREWRRQALSNTSSS